VDKYILFLTIDLDKAESLALIKPLYASFCHSRILLLKYFSSWDTTKIKRHLAWKPRCLALSTFPPTSTTSLSLKGRWRI
jgi:hypothetical protein